MFSILFYLLLFSFSAILVERFVGMRKIMLAAGQQSKTLYIKRIISTFLIGLLCMFPLILLYGLREGIGWDYYTYEHYYEILHKCSFFDYFSLHETGSGAYYVEPGYYLLNRIASNYRILLYLDALFIYIPVARAIQICHKNFSIGLSVFIFLSIEFIYSMDTVRFVLALSYILLAFAYLINEKTGYFFFYTIIATMFHTTAWIALLYFFVKEFKNRPLNKIRNAVLITVIVLFPKISALFFDLAASFPAFQRYFSVNKYSISTEVTISFRWILHIIPVILPVLFILGKRMFETKEERIMFRIFITEIPIRMLGLYNMWFVRLARIPQLIQVIFIPYILSKVSRCENKRLLFVYYIAWYIFEFIYYIFVNDAKKSIPYQWIF